MAKDKYKGIENPEAHRADMERRQSNAAGTHADKREKRKRTRLDAKRAAIESDKN